MGLGLRIIWLWKVVGIWSTIFFNVLYVFTKISSFKSLHHCCIKLCTTWLFLKICKYGIWICVVDQMTGFHMECNTVLKWFNKLNVAVNVLNTHCTKNEVLHKGLLFHRCAQGCEQHCTENEIFQETADLVKWKTSFYCAVRYQNDVVWIRRVFRTLSNIYDEALLWKLLTAFSR